MAFEQAGRGVHVAAGGCVVRSEPAAGSTPVRSPARVLVRAAPAHGPTILMRVVEHAHPYGDVSLCHVLPLRRRRCWCVAGGGVVLGVCLGRSMQGTWTGARCVSRQRAAQCRQHRSSSCAVVAAMVRLLRQSTQAVGECVEARVLPCVEHVGTACLRHHSRQQPASCITQHKSAAHSQRHQVPLDGGHTCAHHTDKRAKLSCSVCLTCTHWRLQTTTLLHTPAAQPRAWCRVHTHNPHRDNNGKTVGQKLAHTHIGGTRMVRRDCISKTHRVPAPRNTHC
jgi:hypothetical protein